MGYGAIALKAIAKTLSMTMRIAQAAHERDVPCFCADLTVNPILVEWNKAMAARLAPFPGLLETNGLEKYQGGGVPPRQRLLGKGRGHFCRFSPLPGDAAVLRSNSPQTLKIGFIKVCLKPGIISDPAGSAGFH